MPDEDGTELFTVERPWLDNQPNISCIPEGIYRLQSRPSAVVERSTKGEFSEGWEVVAVPNRTFIMIHPGNWPDEFEGCIGVGLDYGMLNNRLAVINSRAAFRMLMESLDPEETHEIQITPYFVNYPGKPHVSLKASSTQ